MIVCSHDFLEPCPKNPRYADNEIDFYAWIPRGDAKDHRLSLRKNITTGKFEVYRCYSMSRPEEVIFEGGLQEALRYGDDETVRCLGYDPGDQVCDHTHHKERKTQPLGRTPYLTFLRTISPFLS